MYTYDELNNLLNDAYERLEYARVTGDTSGEAHILGEIEELEFEFDQLAEETNGYN